jgi:hypothetical protein
MTGKDLIIFYKKMIDFIETNDLGDHNFSDTSESYMDGNIELNELESIQYGIPKTPECPITIEHLKSETKHGDIVVCDTIDSLKAKELRGLV